MFVQSLEGNVIIWFTQLATDSIHYWNELITIFKNQWGFKKDLVYYLTKFEELKRNPSEPIADYIKRFNKIYRKMPPNCRPPVTSTKVSFSKAFDDDFAVILREITSHTLKYMQANSIEVEANRSAPSKLKDEVEKDERRMKVKEECSSSKTKNNDKKFD